MTTKEWFSRGRRLESHINRLLQTKQDEWDKLTKITANTNGDTVQATKDPHKYDGYADLCYYIDTEVDRLERIKAEIMQTILKLRDLRYRDILIGYYVNMKSFEQIAVEMRYSYVHVTRLHGWALKAAERLLKDDKEC